MFAKLRPSGQPTHVEDASRIAQLTPHFEKLQGIMRECCSIASAHLGDGFQSVIHITPNPYYCQLIENGGIAVVLTCGQAPGSFWTPLGEIGWSGSMSGGKNFYDCCDALGNLMQRLGATLYEPPPRHAPAPGDGKVYWLRRDLTGGELPRPEVREKKDFLPYLDAAKLWNQVKPPDRDAFDLIKIERSLSSPIGRFIESVDTDSFPQG